MENSIGKVLSVNISLKRGEKKKPVESAKLRANYGVEGDAHAGFHPIRQISILAIESHKKMIEKGVDVHPGDFAENMTTEGIDVASLPVGTRMVCGDVELEVTQIGKECHSHCQIFKQVGDCVMPREGIFVKALSNGTVKPGDEIKVIE